MNKNEKCGQQQQELSTKQEIVKSRKKQRIFTRFFVMSNDLVLWMGGIMVGFSMEFQSSMKRISHITK